MTVDHSQSITKCNKDREAQTVEEIAQRNVYDLSKKQWSSINLALPSDEEIQKTVSNTAALIDSIIESRSKNDTLSRTKATLNKPDEYVTVKLKEGTPGYNPTCAKRIARITSETTDPLDPSRMKVATIPKANTTPIVPILRREPEKMSSAERAMWAIPKAISRWKNPKGDFVSLEERIKSDVRFDAGISISGKFNEFGAELQKLEENYKQGLATQKVLEEQHRLKLEEDREQRLRHFDTSSSFAVRTHDNEQLEVIRHEITPNVASLPVASSPAAFRGVIDENADSPPPQRPQRDRSPPTRRPPSVGRDSQSDDERGEDRCIRRRHSQEVSPPRRPPPSTHNQSHSHLAEHEDLPRRIQADRCSPHDSRYLEHNDHGSPASVPTAAERHCFSDTACNEKDDNSDQNTEHLILERPTRDRSPLSRAPPSAQRYSENGSDINETRTQKTRLDRWAHNREDDDATIPPESHTIPCLADAPGKGKEPDIIDQLRVDKDNNDRGQKRGSTEKRGLDHDSLGDDGFSHEASEEEEDVDGGDIDEAEFETELRMAERLKRKAVIRQHRIEWNRLKNDKKMKYTTDVFDAAALGQDTEGATSVYDTALYEKDDNTNFLKESGDDEEITLYQSNLMHRSGFRHF